MNAEPIRNRRRQDASGFALVLAILALMLLTFLGLTLATTSSTELQIATNYRWSQQALYNAEAGLEAGKLILANAATGGGNWAPLVPTARTIAWNWGDTTTSTQPAGWSTSTGRDFERSGTSRDTAMGITACQGRGGSIGYGIVLNGSAPDGSSPTGGRWENVTTFMGQRLNGAFTLWVRRRLQVDASGKYTDDPTNPPDTLVLTAEGVAPYASTQNVTTTQAAFTRASQAVRVVEMTYTLATQGKGCTGSEYAQQGGGQSGENFNPCATLGDSSVGQPFGTGPGGRVGSGGATGAGTLKKLP